MREQRFDSEDFQKYMMNVCLAQKKYISPSKDVVSRNDDMKSYMLDFYKNDKLGKRDLKPARTVQRYAPRAAYRKICLLAPGA